MTIEFRCQYCTAAITVGDEAAGRSGKCPVCGIRLTVPRPAGLVTATSPEVPTPEVVVAPAPPPSSVELSVFTGVASESPSVPATPESPFSSREEDERLQRVQRRRKRSQARTRRQIVTLVSSAAVLGIIVGGYFLWQDWKSRTISGTVNAISLETMDSKPVLVPRALLPLGARQVGTLLEKLAEHAVPLTSDLMAAEIGGSTEGLLLSVQPGKRTQWYRVDVASNPALRQFADRTGARQDVSRSQQVRDAAKEFAETYLKVLANELDVQELTPFRDRLVIPGLVRGLGTQVSAIGGQVRYPCVLEDDDSLYFLMPPGLKEFEIVGRKIGEKRSTFPGSVTAVVRTE